MRFRDVPGLTALFVDWMEGVPGARALLPFLPDKVALREQAISARNRSETRGRIHHLLKSQAGEFNAGEPAMKNIERLLLPDSVVILASLPPVLAGGPLSILLKCFTTAKLAAELESAGIPAFPMCWLAHDPRCASNTASIGLLDQDAQLRRVLLQSSDGAAGGTGCQWPIPPEIERWVSALVSTVEADPKDAAIQELIRAYHPGTPFSKASARFISSLLNEWGIVLLDPAAPEFRATLMDSLHHSRFSHERAAFLFCRREEELRRAGYARPPADSNSGFPQERGGPDAPDRDVSPGPLTPLFIEAVLPVAAHVIGHHEIQDYALALPVFPEIGLLPPLLWPAASATLVDARSRRNMEKHGIVFADLLAGRRDLVRRLTREEEAKNVVSRLDALSESITSGLAGVKASAGSGVEVDLMLSDTRSRALYQLGKLRERFEAAIAVRREVISRQVDRISSTLLPEGGLQESAVSGLHFILRNSTDFLPRLYERLDIQSFEHQLIPVE